MQINNSFKFRSRSLLIRILTLLVGYALVLPIFAGLSVTTATASRDQLAPTPVPSPSPAPSDGRRQVTAGPYVPPALRTDNQRLRGIGVEGKVVDPLPVKGGAPMLHLPDLSTSR